MHPMPNCPILRSIQTRHHRNLSCEICKKIPYHRRPNYFCHTGRSLYRYPKRPTKGLLAGLYEFPNTPGHLSREEAISYVENMGLEALYIEELPDAKHIFSHIEWRMTAYRIKVSSFEKAQKEKLIFADRKQTDKTYAIPSAFGAYVKYMKEDI